MKKLIGVIAILFTLLVCIIYRHLTSGQAEAKPEAACKLEPLRHGLLFTALLMQ
ncbi:MAG TPA: hypothetical protein VFE32_10550 [Puia sp.]|nr:hypothetical protein [Puia sp.]